MPKLKQVDSLEKMAMDLLFKLILRRCNETRARVSLLELCKIISYTKDRVCNCIRRDLLPNFLCKFLDEFYSTERPASHYEAASEIIMDREITGLRCGGRILKYMNDRDLHRIHGLIELELTGYKFDRIPPLENFRLQNLIAFQFEKYCEDDHLMIIGQNCLKLAVLKIPHSSGVTDEGLRSLSGCSELRVVNVWDRSFVTVDGLTHLLSVNKKLEELHHFHHEFEIDFLQRLDTSLQCQSMKCLRFVELGDRGELFDLNNIVAKFPNLTYLDMHVHSALDFSKLKSLDQLKELEFFLSHKRDTVTAVMWADMKQLLTVIGRNITVLTAYTEPNLVGWQDSLDFVFKFCPNLEYFGFDHDDGLLVIPPYQKLKELSSQVKAHEGTHPRLEFSELLNLKTLCLVQYAVDFQDVKSIMLDHINFPKLSLIKITAVPAEELKGFEKIARDNNLDFKIENSVDGDHVHVNGKLGYQSPNYLSINDSD